MFEFVDSWLTKPLLIEKKRQGKPQENKIKLHAWCISLGWAHSSCHPKSLEEIAQLSSWTLFIFSHRISHWSSSKNRNVPWVDMDSILLQHFVLFWGHDWWCSRATLSSALKNHSWWVLEAICCVRDHPGQRVCKVSTLEAILSSWPHGAFSYVFGV